MTELVTSIASVLMVVVSGLLWSVNRNLVKLQRLSHKNTLDPDLRTFDRWDPEDFVVEKSAGEKTVHLSWVGDVHLWNTGASTILVTGWEAVADEHGTVNLWKEHPEVMTTPPIAIAAHSEVRVKVKITGVGVRGISFRYQTSQTPNRDLFVPVKTERERLSEPGRG